MEVTIEPEAHSPDRPPEFDAAVALAKVALDRKAFDIAILDMRTLVHYTDVFLLISGRNRRHVAALAEDLRAFGKKDLGITCLGTEGLPAARWVLVDFGSVVIHLFEEPLRAFYNLDGLWGDAPKIPSPEIEDESVEAEVEPPLP